MSAVTYAREAQLMCLEQLNARPGKAIRGQMARDLLVAGLILARNDEIQEAKRSYDAVLPYERALGGDLRSSLAELAECIGETKHAQRIVDGMEGVEKLVASIRIIPDKLVRLADELEITTNEESAAEIGDEALDLLEGPALEINALRSSGERREREAAAYASDQLAGALRLAILQAPLAIEIVREVCHPDDPFRGAEEILNSEDKAALSRANQAVFRSAQRLGTGAKDPKTTSREDLRASRARSEGPPNPRELLELAMQESERDAQWRRRSRRYGSVTGQR